MRLAGKAAIVTGAGRNIGEATARLFAREGAKVAVVDLDEDRAERVAAVISSAGGTARPFVADVSEEAQVEALIRDVSAAFGRIDILINNVAISDNKHILDITKQEWDRVIAVTLTGPFLMGKHVAKAMVAQGSGGVIVNVGSTSGYFGRPRAIAYTAAKGGVRNLTRSMAIQLAPHNIRVMTLVPNKIGSPVGKDTFNPDRPVRNLRMNRPGVPEDVARALLFLASDDADFITGSELFVDGGVTAILPGSD
ncbi:MAG TPA: glucose 1-dehydrogenase [Hyphomicrobiaceae bacterium]|nr:glucose 1-dehydrogenase [Hyphomicrobiaceae bacterium]